MTVKLLRKSVIKTEASNRTSRGAKSRTTQNAGKCSARGTGDAIQVVQFKTTLRNVDQYLERERDASRAYQSYRIAKRQLRSLPKAIQKPCEVLLEKKMGRFRVFYLDIARDLAKKNNCKDARSRALHDARGRFNASMEEVNEALGPCSSDGDSNPAGQNDTGSPGVIDTGPKKTPKPLPSVPSVLIEI